jgi:hypothetical protein
MRIVGLLHGLSADELQARPGVPVLLKKRDFLELNDVQKYFQELRRRVRLSISKQKGNK